MNKKKETLPNLFDKQTLFIPTINNKTNTAN